MFTNVSSEQIDEYRRDGVLVVENFLDDDELAVWRKNVDEAVEHSMDRKDGLVKIYELHRWGFGWSRV